jgi:H+/Cl- antiporter ClcA
MPRESPQPNVLGSGTLRALSPLFWVLVVVTGVGAGLAGGLLMLLLHAVQHTAWPYRPGDKFLSAVQHATPLRIMCVLAIAGLLAGVVRFLLRQETGGGHGGELAERIWFHAGRLDPLRTLVRAVLSIVIVGMGASLGREAAPKQTGALVASILAQWAGISDSQRRLLAACGAGAGIAAVYNVPFGGAMFALEVLLGTIALPLIPPALVAALIGTAVSWLMLPDAPTYHIPFYPVSASQIVWAAIAGPIAALVAVAYVRLIAWADTLRPRGMVAVIASMVVFSVLGAVAIRYPQLLGNGKDVVQLAFLGQLGLPLLLALVVLKPVATAACLGSGAPGGLFTPTLTLGALLGGLLGYLWLHLWPGGPLGAFAIIGAGAVLAASTQGPVSAVILVLELTRRLDTLMVPVILAIGVAVFVARNFENRSIYSGRIHLGRSAAGRAAGEKEAKGFIAISSSAHFPELLQALLRGTAKPEPVYVVDEKGRLMGEVRPDRVRDPPPETLPLETATAADFATPVPAILTTDGGATASGKFATAGNAALPVIDDETGALVGVSRPSGQIAAAR